MRRVLAYLSNFKTKRIQYAVVVVLDRTLQVYEGQRCELAKATTFDSDEDAKAAAERFLARREKTGWQAWHRIESPWVRWIAELERLWHSVISDAKASNVPIGVRSSFTRGFPSAWSDEKLAEVVPSPEYADMARVGGVAMRFQLGDERLSFYEEFFISTRQGFPFWRRRDSSTDLEAGTFEGGVLVSALQDETIRHANANEFRAWFLRHVRDDVIGFEIAELAAR
jgi:hypothetical protein